MKSSIHQSTLHLSLKIKCCVDRLRPPCQSGRAHRQLGLLLLTLVVRKRARAGNPQKCFLSFLLSTVTARAVLLLFNVIETNFLRVSSTSEFSHSLDPKRTFAVVWEVLL